MRVAKYVAISLMAVAAFGCRRAEVASSSHPPVIVISVDTLRSDHLPAYGYKGVDTPNIDALRKDAILFTRAYSEVPLRDRTQFTVDYSLLRKGSTKLNTITFGE